MAIALPLVSSRNVEEVIAFLKAQLIKTREEQQEKARTLFMNELAFNLRDRILSIGSYSSNRFIVSQLSLPK
jgi:hypothetical protein